MSYYDHATLMALRLGPWSEGSSRSCHPSSRARAAAPSSARGRRATAAWTSASCSDETLPKTLLKEDRLDMKSLLRFAALALASLPVLLTAAIGNAQDLQTSRYQDWTVRWQPREGLPSCNMY